MACLGGVPQKAYSRCGQREMEESKQKLECVTVTMTVVVDSESRGNAELTSELSHMEIRNFHPYQAKFSLKT